MKTYLLVVFPFSTASKICSLKETHEVILRQQKNCQVRFDKCLLHALNVFRF